MNSIETINLVKKFGEKVAVNNLNLTVEEGELFSLLGVNGAGKTTTIKMLTCLIRPTSGDALLENVSVLTDPQHVKKITNASPQETAVATKLTVEENLVFMAGIYGYQGEELKNRVNAMVEKFHLEEVIKSKASVLSGGWQRRLSIALALISEPKILFLDEPTLGLDVIARRELWRIIKALKGNTTIVLTTHYMEEAEALSDRIGIMSKGELKAIGTAEELKQLAGKDNFEDAFIAIAEGEEAGL